MLVANASQVAHLLDGDGPSRTKNSWAWQATETTDAM